MTFPDSPPPARGDGPPRIAPAVAHGNPPATQQVLDTLAATARRSVPNLFLTLARHPALLPDYLPLGSRLLLGGTLPARDRELAILRTAWLCGCEYEWGHHVRFAARAGLSPAEVAGIADPAAAEWSGHDTAVLRATGELVSGHTISEATWTALARSYDDAALVEFAMLVGHYVMLAGLLNAARVARDEGTEAFPAGPVPGTP